MSTALSQPALPVANFQSETAVLAFLLWKGFNLPGLAGLSLAELAEELPAPVDEHILVSLRKQAWRSVQRLPLRLPACALLPPGRKSPQPTACNPAPLALAPAAPPRMAPRPVYKHSSVAAALVDAVLQDEFTALFPAMMASGFPAQWKADLADSLLACFQPGTIAAALRTWYSSSRLASRGHTPPVLIAQQARGHTVPAAIFNHFKRLHDELGVKFPLSGATLREIPCCSKQHVATASPRLDP